MQEISLTISALSSVQIEGKIYRSDRADWFLDMSDEHVKDLLSSLRIFKKNASEIAVALLSCDHQANFVRRDYARQKNST